MTAKTLMFEDTIGGVLYRSEKATNPFRDGVRTNVLKMMKYNEIKYVRSFIALLVLITMKFFKQLRPKQLQTVGPKRHHHIRMDNINCCALLMFSGTKIEYFLNVSVSAKPNNMYHVVRVLDSLYSDALYLTSSMACVKSCYSENWKISINYLFLEHYTHNLVKIQILQI